jgi:NADP-dependent 3-hydroxy acid dehydrogenase YdfG
MNDKVIVITGASAGIGAALAERAAKKGARVVLVARRKKELEAVAAKCGANAAICVADVTKREDVDRARDEALAKFSQIDVWVNNAGRGISRKVAELTDDDVDDMMRVNVKSALYGMQAVLPHFQSRKKGQIVNVSSLLGRMPLFGLRAAYSASKHALNALTASLRLDLRAEYPDIFVTTVSPGIVATEFGVNALHGGLDSRKMPSAQSAEEVADVILDVIAKPCADAYTRPGAREMIAAYYAAADMGDAETKPPFMGGGPPR